VALLTASRFGALGSDVVAASGHLGFQATGVPGRPLPGTVVTRPQRHVDRPVGRGWHHPADPLSVVADRSGKCCSA